MASDGYPGEYATGHAISGLGDVPGDITVFHAGTKLAPGGYATSGGRVLGVTAAGDTPEAARARAYDGVGKISWSGARYRGDIGGK
jgi:phosphoribosylamine--glycine ligase